jgi:hypothetical protein
MSFIILLHFSFFNDCVGWQLCSSLWAWNGIPLNTYHCTLERTDAIKNEVLEPITFVLAYSTVLPNAANP